MPSLSAISNRWLKASDARKLQCAQYPRTLDNLQLHEDAVQASKLRDCLRGDDKRPARAYESSVKRSLTPLLFEDSLHN